MKKLKVLFSFALVLALLASMFTFSASAEPNTEAGADPNALKPGSDKVYYIKDAPRNENHEVIGELEGDGSGSDPDNPLQTYDHASFDPTAERKKWSFMTALYQATEILAEEGGTIVICGPVYIGEEECNDNGSIVRDSYTAEYKNNVIKITSVYDGVDYRKEAGAKLTIASPAMISFRGSTILENLDIETVGTGRALTFANYCTLIGEGINCYPSDGEFEGVASHYPSIAAGTRWESSNGQNPTLLVKSGTYNRVCGAQLGTAKNYNTENANVYLTIEGTTRVLGNVYGTVQGTSDFSGNVNITIKGGYFEGDIWGVGPTGMLNEDGIVSISISGGDFSNAYSICQAPMNMTNNLPARAAIDFSRWKGDTLALAYANVLVSDITEIRYPAGVTADKLLKALEEASAATEPADSEEATQPPVEDQTPDATEGVTQDPVADEKAPETQVTAPDVDDNNSGSTAVIIIVAVVAVVIAGVVVAIVLKKKKAAK
ncbi:MAG: hypothetical protein IKU48_04130 [Clostridia bacterium]|nr:hypothetical protein [Clostridia bacterium]